MAFSAFKNMKPFPQLLFSAFIIVVCFLAFTLLSLGVAIPIFGIDTVMDMASFSDLSKPEGLRFLKYIQTTQAIGLFIIPSFLLGYLFHGKAGEYLHLNKPFHSSMLFLVLALILLAGPFINFTGSINSNMTLPGWLAGVEEWMKNAEEKAATITEAFLNVTTTGGLLFNLFMIALLPALGEELLFRGIIQPIFTRMTRNYHLGIWISAILFSALHMQFYGFIPRVLLGAIFGYLLVWSGSLWLPIIGHFFNNAIAVIAIYLINNKFIDAKFEEIGTTNDSYYMAGISFVLIFALLGIIKRKNIQSTLSKKN